MAIEDPISSTDKTRVQIINEIYGEITSDTMKDRLIAALNKHPTFALALDDFNYSLAAEIIGDAETAGDITASDKTMILSKIPS